MAAASGVPLVAPGHQGTGPVVRPFADARLAAYGTESLAQYEDLLMAPDPDVYNWIVGRETPEPAYDTPVLHDVIAFHGSRHA